MNHSVVESRFQASKSAGEVSAVLVKPDAALALLVLGHGAGAGMRHRFMDAIAERLADRGIATFRYQFPYMEQGSRRPSPQPLLLATVRSAIEAAQRAAPGLPVVAGGKSMGGRMTSLAAAKEPLLGVSGIVFFGFPLHASGKPGTERAQHLAELSLPLLFLQGTRDRLADLALLEPICQKLGARAELHIVEGGDHSFHVLKRSGRSDEDALDELAERTREWVARVAPA